LRCKGQVLIKILHQLLELRIGLAGFKGFCQMLKFPRNLVQAITTRSQFVVRNCRALRGYIAGKHVPSLPICSVSFGDVALAALSNKAFSAKNADSDLNIPKVVLQKNDEASGWL
jgi:hypothetical protein